MGSVLKAPIPFLPPDDLAGRSVGRFLIRFRLGAGGMGEVYYAEDTELKRPVALKRVTHKLGDDPAARQQILHEARRASALSSEHIANVYDVVEDRNDLFLVMEYVDGVTLREQLRRKGPMPVESFLAIAMQSAEALAEAEHKGIVHRDIKPENIMLTPAGRIKILDFGLARRLPVADPTAVTASWESLEKGCAGTSGYMAPEILMEQAVDARSDVFSLGIVFYEMLTGSNPFFTEKPMVAADRILHYQPPPVTTQLDGVPADLDRIVSRMLTKDPGRRCSAAELLADLQALQQAGRGRLTNHPQVDSWWKTATRRGIMLLLVLLAFSVFPGLWPHKPPLPERKHLAVLPFVPAGEDPSARAFCRGLTETLTAKLSQLTDRYPLQVVSPSEVRAQSANSVEEARAALGVNLVLEGSFHQAGPNVRVTYNLVDATTQRVLRADTITAQAADPFALEDRVVDSAVQALDLELGAQERRALTAHGTRQPDAYDFYLRGRGYLQEYQKPESVDSAIDVFQRSLDRDPDYALAWAGLGESYWQKYELTHDRAWVAKASGACQRASARGVGHNCLGTVYNGTGKYEQAVAEFQSSLEADRTDDLAYRGLATAYEHLGQLTDAEQTYRRAINMRPEYWGGYSWLGAFFYKQARYAEAAQMFAQVIALAPDNARGYSNLCGTYIMAGRYADAIPICGRSAKITPTQDAYTNLGIAYFYLRRFPEASRSCEQAVKLDPKQRSLWGNLGDAYYWDPLRRSESVAAYRKAIALGEEDLHVNPRNATLLSYLAVYHAMVHEQGAAWDNLNQALASAPDNAEVLLNAALVANQFQESGTAIRFLHRALAAGLPPALVLSNPNFDNLQSNQQFQNFLQKKIPADQTNGSGRT